MLYLIISLFVWIFVAVTSVLFFPVALIIFLITFPFDKRGVILHRFSCFWGSLYVWINPLWKVLIQGKENIRKNEPMVFVSNHQSLLDIILMYNLFTHFKWVSKDSLFRIPFVGWNMSLNNYIKLKRKDPKSHLSLMKQSEKHLQRGSSIFLFPEGTRSPDGEIHRFKDGAFLIAKKNRVGVQPVLIEGAYQAIPKKGFIMDHRQRIIIKVLPAVQAEEVKALKVKEISSQVQTDLKNGLKELRTGS